MNTSVLVSDIQTDFRLCVGGHQEEEGEEGRYHLGGEGPTAGRGQIRGLLRFRGVLPR